MKAKLLYMGAVVFLLAGAINAQGTTAPKDASAEAGLNAWGKFKYPKVVFKNEDLKGNGKFFAEYIANPDSLEKAVDLKVCQLLYKDPSEVPEISKVVLTVKSMDGVAYTSGLRKPTEKTTVVSSNYLKSIMDRMKDKPAIVNELAGVVTHETVHIYQKSCKKDSPDHGSMIEGIADAIRYYAGVDNISRRHKGGTWTGAYTTTGFFIVWLQEKYDKDFLYKLNKYAGETEEFHWENAMQTLLNKPVKALWDEYQAAI